MHGIEGTKRCSVRTIDRRYTLVEKYDVIIIGSGLGGLTTAGALAKKGKKVIVLEQHFVVGGCATTFKRKNITFEVGLHEMDWGTTDRDMKQLIFKRLGITDKVPLVDLPEAWRILADGETYTIPHGRENVIEYLGGIFPNEKKNLKRYFANMKFTISTNRAFPNDLHPVRFFFYPLLVLPSIIVTKIEQATAYSKINHYIKDQKLRNILNANISYYSDSPTRLSWYLHSSAQYSYYNSAKFIKGGSQVLSNVLADVIKENGGEIHLSADVQKIELEGNKAVGVSYIDKKTKESHTLYAKQIVANCSPELVYNGKMVDKKYFEPSVKGIPSSSSLWTVYAITKEKLCKKYPNMAYSTFIFPDGLLENDSSKLQHYLTTGKPEERGLVFVDYSTIDAGLVPEGDDRGFIVLCGGSSLAEWDGLSDEDYKAKKEEFTQIMFKKVEAQFPGFIETVEYSEMSTPKTIKRYIRQPDGSAYGYIQNKFTKGRVPTRSKVIKNLFFSGASTFPGCGFTGTLVSGYYSAIEMRCPMWVRVAGGTILATICGFLIAQVITKVVVPLIAG